MFQTNLYRKWKHILCSKNVPRKSCRLWDSVGIFYTAGHVTVGNIIRSRKDSNCILGNKGKNTDRHNHIDVRGSVHHSIIHKENPTRCNNVSKFYFIFMWSSDNSTCPASSNYTSNNPPRMQNQWLLVQFRLLMMGGVARNMLSFT